MVSTVRWETREDFDVLPELIAETISYYESNIKKLVDAWASNNCTDIDQRKIVGLFDKADRWADPSTIPDLPRYNYSAKISLCLGDLEDLYKIFDKYLKWGMPD